MARWYLDTGLHPFTLSIASIGLFGYAAYRIRRARPYVERLRKGIRDERLVGHFLQNEHMKAKPEIIPKRSASLCPRESEVLSLYAVDHTHEVILDPNVRQSRRVQVNYVVSINGDFHFTATLKRASAEYVPDPSKLDRRFSHCLLLD